ncbi:MAG: ATP-binding protein [Bacilli bacterium]|nr:ATP-binding protein [Erysipelotrichaceae bacterium]MDY4819335.1 ATP-binding protein [Bacilli bacterium]
MINRDKYLNQLIKAKNNGFPKVITGVRRCGKSYLLTEIYKNYLLSNGVKKDNILIIELDDDRNSDLLNPLKLGAFVREWCKEKDNCYVFLDEIQRVFRIINPILTNGKIVIAKEGDENTISFVEVILGLSRESNIDLYVTGSNSKMLSKEVASEFRDKAIEIHMRPLSFYEYFSYVGGSKSDALMEYMMYGGMPLAVLSPKEEKELYLKKLFDKTYFKDIIEHNKITKTESLDELCKILSSCTGDLLNSERIANTYKSIKHEKIDKETVTKYIDFFKDAMLIDEVERFDLKGRNIIGSTRKYYFSDIGLRNAKENFTFFDEGKVIENIIYNELIYNNFNVSVGAFESFEKNKEGKTIRVNYEVDFYATRGNDAFYFQISADINNLETKNRELKPFTKINDGTRKVLVVNRPIPLMKDERNYIIIGLTDFLLEYIK